MKPENKLLHSLLDSYDRATTKGTESKRSITKKIDKKSLPIYFDESSDAYLGIHERLIRLEETGAIELFWKNKRKGHILEKVRLVKPEVLFNYLNRTSLSTKNKRLKETALKLKEKYGSSQLVNTFIEDIIYRIKEGYSLNSLIDINDLNSLFIIVKILFFMDKNSDSCFIREFSVRYFSDSKLFGKKLPQIIRILKNYFPDYKMMDDNEILAEYNIYHNPIFINLKGKGIISISNQCIDLSLLTTGISLSEEDISNVNFIDLCDVEKIVTVENLTSFMRISEPNSLYIYIGGFHSRIHRELLKKLYNEFPNLTYYHFGDIDVGGFYILFDLIKKSGIPFKPYKMNKEIINNFKQFTSPLTKNDKKRLERLIDNLKQNEICKSIAEEEKNVYIDTLEYLLESDCKLEQEALFWN